MTGRRHMGLVAAAATLLAAAPLSAIFENWTWLVQCLLAVVFIAGAATLARTARAPLWGQLLAMMGALLLALTWMFPSGREIAAVIPSFGTLENFASLMSESAKDMRAFAVPVPDSDPLLFVTVLGVGSVAILVDLVSVGLRRPALAGLPMLAIYSVPVAVYPETVPVIPFVIGAFGFLWLLVADKVDSVRRFGRRFTGDGRDVDVWEPSPLAAAGRRLAVVGVVLAVLLPIAVPGMTTGLMEKIGGGAGSGTGLGGGRGGNVNLFAALAGQLRQTQTTTLVRVSTSDPNPYYLRFAVADELTNQGFRARSPRGQSLRSLEDPRENPRSGVTYQAHHARVEVTDRFEMSLAPTYGEPVDIDGLGGDWQYDQNMQVVFSNDDTARDKEYSFDYVESEFTVEALRAAPPLAANSVEATRYTQTPSVRQVSTLVNQLTRGKDTGYDKVMAIYDYLSSDEFTYSLQTQGGTSGEDIVNFLNNKQGFCQQYAAAMAWMVRAADIPARVAFGFTNGTARDGDSTILTNLNLHAWTEVYFGPDYGWVPFDATPQSSVPGSTRPAWAPDPNALPSTSPSSDASAGPGATVSPGGPGQDPERGRFEGEGASGTLDTSGPTWPMYLLGTAIVLLALLATPALRRSLVRRRRQSITAAATALASRGSGSGADAPGVPTVLVTGAEAARVRANAHAAWDELIDTMVDYRVPIDPTETPRATAERLVQAELWGDAVDEARLLGRAEERARYARSPIAGTGLTGALRAVRRSLSEKATRRTRVLAVVLPPSVLARWRTAVVDVTTSVVATTGTVRDRLLRWSPRRLLTNRAR
jgi:transglutaminase-like putative cysteine protease